MNAIHITSGNTITELPFNLDVSKIHTYLHTSKKNNVTCMDLPCLSSLGYPNARIYCLKNVPLSPINAKATKVYRIGIKNTTLNIKGDAIITNIANENQLDNLCEKYLQLIKQHK